MGAPVVIDLSHWNPTPDWNRIAAAGVVGVIHKATEGTTYIDETLFGRAAAAIDAGLCWATYHFLRPGYIREQVEHYLDTINPVPGERVCIDHEADATLDELREAISIIVDMRPDLQIALYSGYLIKEQLADGDLGETDILRSTSLWIAHYTGADEPDWPRQTWPAWSLWQYTDQADVEGISEPVDGNRWNGDVDALIDWFGPLTQAPPEPVRKKVFVNIQADPGIDVEVHINGEPVI